MQPRSGTWSAAEPTARPGEKELGPHLDDRRDRRVALGEEETEASRGVGAAQRKVLRSVGLLGNKCQAPK